MPPSIPHHSQSLTDKKFQAQRFVPDVSPFCLNLTDLKRANYRCDINRSWATFDSRRDVVLSIINPLIRCTCSRLITFMSWPLSRWVRRLRVTGLKWHGNLAHGHVSAELHHRRCVGPRIKWRGGKIKGYSALSFSFYFQAHSCFINSHS